MSMQSDTLIRMALLGPMAGVGNAPAIPTNRETLDMMLKEATSSDSLKAVVDDVSRPPVAGSKSGKSQAGSQQGSVASVDSGTSLERASRALSFALGRSLHRADSFSFDPDQPDNEYLRQKLNRSRAAAALNKSSGNVASYPTVLRPGGRSAPKAKSNYDVDMGWLHRSEHRSYMAPSVVPYWAQGAMAGAPIPPPVPATPVELEDTGRRLSTATVIQNCQSTRASKSKRRRRSGAVAAKPVSGASEDGRSGYSAYSTQMHAHPPGDDFLGGVDPYKPCTSSKASQSGVPSSRPQAIATMQAEAKRQTVTRVNGKSVQVVQVHVDPATPKTRTPEPVKAASEPCRKLTYMAPIPSEDRRRSSINDAFFSVLNIRCTGTPPSPIDAPVSSLTPASTTPSPSRSNTGTSTLYSRTTPSGSSSRSPSPFHGDYEDNCNTKPDLMFRASSTFMDTMNKARERIGRNPGQSLVFNRASWQMPMESEPMVTTPLQAATPAAIVPGSLASHATQLTNERRSLEHGHEAQRISAYRPDVNPVSAPAPVPQLSASRQDIPAKTLREQELNEIFTRSSNSKKRKSFFAPVWIEGQDQPQQQRNVKVQVSRPAVEEKPGPQPQTETQSQLQSGSFDDFDFGFAASPTNTDINRNDSLFIQLSSHPTSLGLFKPRWIRQHASARHSQMSNSSILAGKKKHLNVEAPHDVPSKRVDDRKGLPSHGWLSHGSAATSASVHEQPASHGNGRRPQTTMVCSVLSASPKPMTPVELGMSGGRTLRRTKGVNGLNRGSGGCAYSR
ncbi:uncharacterized protein BCR38DRAFT_412414 [Pseudomassariella vexata]|uniref:Uncharacterized protein n=1 Tax=Pseudomassariella vexata TaxID=1141098 RepID=A0A1Y2DLS8_9PEZI|nr:uncharacterized protein BCR38DRAFT_412414 [Pseudomassariella vexata]ORY60233.1 hypothetical protein BCR38DRAFT_412414 [Pseudomassariella vexata]